jgi:hypothetical protein
MRLLFPILVLLAGCKSNDEWFVQSLTGEEATIKHQGKLYTVQCKSSYVIPHDDALPKQYPSCGSLIRGYVGRSIPSRSFPPPKPDADGWVAEMSIDEEGGILRLERDARFQDLSKHKEWYREIYSIISITSQP